MNKFHLIITLLMLSLFNANAQKKVDPNFHLYILMGQSNMAGRGVITEEFKNDGHPRLMMLNAASEWVLAKNPVHFDKPSVAGVGPGLAFGIDMAKANPNVKIGLIPCAVGGTRINQWQPGAYDKTTNTHPYDDAVVRIKAAMKWGVIKGVVWHQGEGNSSVEHAPLYLGSLDTLINRIRTLVGNPKLPFIVGELGHYKESYRRLNEQLAKVPTTIPFTGLATSEDLVDKGDGTHFDAPSANKLGHRFAAKMLEVQKKSK